MRNFAQFPTAQYIGQYFIKPINIGGRQGVAAPFLFNWLSYGASTAVPALVVPLDMSSLAKTLGALRSVYIDNTGSDTPIYVYFPDTQQTIVCQPNCTIWAPCYTNNMQAWVAGLGFLTGDIPSTYIMFTNLTVPPAVDIELATAINLWRASSSITRGNTIYNSNLGVPALGDQTINYFDAPSGLGVIHNNLWGTPFASGFIYLTNFFSSAIWNTTSTGDSLQFVIESTGSAGILFNFYAQCAQSVFQILFQGSAMNIKLDATQTWRIRVTHINISASMVIQNTLNWTNNPQ